MSSHHIVREKQEPALLVLGLDNFTDEQLGQLLEWSPTLMATSAIAEKLNVYGIKIDCIVANNADNDTLQSDIKYLPLGNDTPVTAALTNLIAQGYPAVNIVTDEFDLAAYMPFADKINLVIFYNQQKIYAVSPGFSKWKPAGERISLLTDAPYLQTTGLQKDGETYITTTDGIFSLIFDGSLLFIAEGL